MTLELSAEEIVTNLLTSNEVIKAKCENKYISYQDIDLGKYSMRIEENLSSLPKWEGLGIGTTLQETSSEKIIPPPSPLHKEGETNEEPSENSESSKYSFIKGSWKI